ncbi:hypothetical protein BDF21DRAFT_406343 [Thamnidium elegans]|nr:hypothetical protein BDF21DRAFT_406343 [Thamnidium elegans]
MISTPHEEKMIGEPLLSENVANVVTAVSLATRISLRCSSLFLDALFEAAKYGTSLSLGITRNTLTNALVTAKNLHSNDLLLCSSKQERESLFMKVLEKYTNIGLYIVSHTFSLAELFAMSGLQFTSRTIQSSLKAAEESVRIVDGIFGANDTSRAIASFITLLHRELEQDPDFVLSKSGKVTILAGLTKALTIFAVLQNVTHKRMMKQIPMTILWEGLVTDEKEDLETDKIIQFKKNKTTAPVTTKNKLSDDTLIIQELNALLRKEDSNNNNMYNVTTQTTCITTKTTTICPIDSIYNKKIIVKTNEEENGSFLATLLDQENKDPQFIISALSEKRRKRKVERQEDLNLRLSDVLPTTERRYSSPAQPTRQRHASISSSCVVTTTTKDTKKRSNSISSCTSLSMTTSYNTPIPSPSTSSISHEEEIMYYDHGWNFPKDHIINNIEHFMRYASAAYGESFMRILGIGDIPTILPNSHHHHPNHHVFAHHTGNSVEDILLSSYTDRSPLHLHNPSIHALVHYVTVDHASKAIVLTCRGTLGLSDILTDLSMDYTEFSLPTDQDRIFKAHSGMLDAAQLLSKPKGKVYQKIRQGLESYPEYGLVLCGHSLGGGVASLLCVLWSQQIINKSSDLVLLQDKQQGSLNPSFVTSHQSGLPAGRPIHCYAYGPPCVMSLSLSNYCSGLVTSVVHGYDIVSSLSLGLLKDFKNVATSLHAEPDITEEIISRVVGRLQKKKKQEDEDDTEEINEDDQWFWAIIKTMRADMNSEKMYPPSTVYLIETVPHVNQQHKVVLCRCEDVEARFSEIVFTRTMFMDHSPLMYERAIRKLCRGFSNEQ